jgi:hypothetical protein
MKEDAIYLRHILECIRRIEENSAGGRAQFMGSHTFQDAVLRNLQTLSTWTKILVWFFLGAQASRLLRKRPGWPRSQGTSSKSPMASKLCPAT